MKWTWIFTLSCFAVLLQLGIMFRPQCGPCYATCRFPVYGPVPRLILPETISGGYATQWKVEWDGGTAPYTVSWDFGEGAQPNVVTSSGVTGPLSTASVVTPGERLFPQVYTVCVTVMDAKGLFRTESETYTVAPNYLLGVRQ